MQSGALTYIKITSCGINSTWYDTRIGEIFSIAYEDGITYMVNVDVFGMNKLKRIFKAHCKVITKNLLVSNLAKHRQIKEQIYKSLASDEPLTKDIIDKYNDTVILVQYNKAKEGSDDNK